MGVQERKEREKEMRRQAILKAANELFIVKGFNSTTIEDIATKSELSTGTIYQYFRSKEELYASLNVIQLRYTLSQVQEIYNNKRLSSEEKVLGLKDALYRTFLYEPLILRNVLHIQLEDTLPLLSENLLEQILTLTRKIMRTIAKIYEEGIREGKFREDHTMAYADITWAIFTGLVVWEEAKRKINPRKDFIKPTLDKAFDILLFGIKRNSE